MSPPVQILARARRWLARRHAGSARRGQERRRNLVLREAIDMVVAGTDPRIRAVSGYGRKLRPAVERMLAYLGACGNWPAPAIELSARAWSANPLVRTLFANVEELHELLGRSRELREYFRRHPEATEAYVGLSATRHERRASGAALHGDVVQRQVLQTTVHFADHSIFGACGSERELRAQVERRGFAFLVGEALHHLVAQHARRHGPGAGQELLRFELKALEHQHGAIDRLADPHGAPDARLEQLREQLQQAQAGFDGAGDRPTTLDDCIASLREVLSHPERHLAEKRTSLHVNRMNVKLDDRAEPGDTVVFSEISIGSRPPRALILGRCLRSELLPERDRFEEAARVLGG